MSPSLPLVRRFGEPGNVWEVRLELRDGTRVRPGFAGEGSSERIRGDLAEIERATGIAVTLTPR